MKKRKKIIKTFLVNIDMTWSQDYKVRAASVTEAKTKAWEKFKTRPPKKSNFSFSADVMT